MKKNLSISYAITVCNEHEELSKLLDLLKDSIDNADEICILVDHPNMTKEVLDIIDKYDIILGSNFKVKYSELGGDFATFKNEFFNFCTKDYIFQIDADELLGDGLLYGVKNLIRENPADAYNLPRINIVTDIDETWQDNIEKWRWTIYENVLGYDKVVNYPDPQMRLYKNSSNIYWTGKVHEKLIGWKDKVDVWYSTIDLENGVMKIRERDAKLWSILHIKKYDRQIKQNAFYEGL